MSGRRKPINHGTTGGYRAHFRYSEPMCDACRDAAREARGTGPRRPPLPCGTGAAYVRHLDHGEEPCEPCRAANRERTARYHREHGLTPGDPRHGTLNGYGNLGCRCNDCRRVNSKRSAERRARQKWKTPIPSET